MASGSYVVLPLHSQISPDEQRRVFQDFKGVHKIILATNIAETAITIDGIVCIINSGRVKEKRFDPYAGVCTLQSTWITTASERQRRGRAGRTRAGIAFHLYSRQRSRELQVFLPNIIQLVRPPNKVCTVSRATCLRRPGCKHEAFDDLSGCTNPKSLCNVTLNLFWVADRVAKY